MNTVFLKPSNIERKWFVIDAEGKALGRVASRAAAIVRGKEKANFTPNQEMGDFVVIINAEKAALSGSKTIQKRYYRHSGYVGGLKSFSYEKLSERNSVSPIRLAIKGMLPKGPLGRKLFKNVKVYSGSQHPHDAQKPQIINL